MRALVLALVMGALVMGAGPASAGEGQAAAGWTKVGETNKVCMVNDKYMGKEQIPVEVQGKTYYGCCAMCKERLAQDARSREAVDPVSGKTVDKAKAVIAKNASDDVLYFESNANLEKYAARR